MMRALPRREVDAEQSNALGDEEYNEDGEHSHEDMGDGFWICHADFLQVKHPVSREVLRVAGEPRDGITSLRVCPQTFL